MATPIPVRVCYFDLLGLEFLLLSQPLLAKLLAFSPLLLLSLAVGQKRCVDVWILARLLPLRTIVLFTFTVGSAG